MTDPEFADATYIEPITPEWSRRSSPRSARRGAADPRRADRAQPGDGLHESGVLERYGVELIGANAEAIQRARTARSSRAMIEIGLAAAPESRHSHLPHDGRGLEAAAELGYPWSSVPSFTLGGKARASPTTRSSREIAAATAWTPPRSPRSSSRSRSSGGRSTSSRSCATSRQRRDRLLDREPRPDGRPHRRLDHRRARRMTLTDREYQAMRDAAFASSASRRRDRRLQHPVRGQPRRRPHGRHRDEPAGVAPRRWRRRPPASRSPRSPPSSPSATPSTRSPTTSPKQTPASFEPTIDYVVVKVPRFAFEKFPGRRHPHHPDEVGGRGDGDRPHFPEALKKALRSLERTPRLRSTSRRVPSRTSSPTTTSCWRAAARTTDAFRSMRALRRGRPASSRSSTPPGSTRGSSTRSR
jgi:carbamoyl-phosphate synthase large subunit